MTMNEMHEKGVYTYNFTKPNPLPTPSADATDAFFNGPISSNSADKSYNE